MPRGRKSGFKMPEEHRNKIRFAQIVNALQEHVEGTREMSATQVTAGLGLLKKVLPDLQAVQMDANVETNVVSSEPLTADEWARKHSSGEVG